MTIALILALAALTFLTGYMLWRYRPNRSSTANPVLSNEQKALYDILEDTDSHIFITGKAGTGKSALLRYFASHTSKTVVKVAPTGIAALAIGGQTIHSLFRLPIGLVDNRKLILRTETRALLGHLDAVIIDEISMVRADTIDGIDYLLRRAKGNDTPFGGVQIIAFGDPYQLPPVVTDRKLRDYFTARYGGPYFFNAHIWKKTTLTTYELRTVFRQSDEAFKTVLNEIRSGLYTPDTLSKLASRTISSTEHPRDAIILTSTNDVAKAINNQRLARLNTRQRTYRAITTGLMPQSSLPVDHDLALKVGAHVMFTKNDPDGRWVNGTQGVIKSLRKDHIRVKCGGKTYMVLPTTWEQSAYEYSEELNAMTQEVVGTLSQFPLRLAWAITIHKSQGCSYDKVVIDIPNGAFAHGQVYVALSRCRTLNGLYLAGRIEPKDIIIDSAVLKFMDQVRHA